MCECIFWKREKKKDEMWCESKRNVCMCVCVYTCSHISLTIYSKPYAYREESWNSLSQRQTKSAGEANQSKSTWCVICSTSSRLPLFLYHLPVPRFFLPLPSFFPPSSLSLVPFRPRSPFPSLSLPQKWRLFMERFLVFQGTCRSAHERDREKGWRRGKKGGRRKEDTEKKDKARW